MAASDKYGTLCIHSTEQAIGQINRRATYTSCKPMTRDRAFKSSCPNSAAFLHGTWGQWPRPRILAGPGMASLFVR